METIIQEIWGQLAIYGLKVIAALVILVVGRWVAIGFKRFFLKQLDKKAVDPTISRFVGHFTYILLMAFFVLAAVRQLGIQTTSLVAILGAAGLAVGLALRDSLSNFAARFHDRSFQAPSGRGLCGGGRYRGHCRRDPDIHHPAQEPR